MNKKFAKISKYISPFDRSLSPHMKTFLPNLLEIEHILKEAYKSAGCFDRDVKDKKSVAYNNGPERSDGPASFAGDH